MKTVKRMLFGVVVGAAVAGPLAMGSTMQAATATANVTVSATVAGTRLTINGTEDSVIPMEDTLFPYTAGAPRTFFLVPGDDHCAMGNLELVIGVAKSWLDKELAAP